MKRKIYNIPASCGFVDVLAQKFLQEYRYDRTALADALFLLPNRRAVKALTEAFVREDGLSPMLLPRMMPLGETEEDELFLTGGGRFRNGENVFESGLLSGAGTFRAD